MRYIIPLTLMLLMLALGACGDDDDDAEEASATSPAVVPSVAQPGAQPVPPQALDSDSMQPEDGVIEISAQASQFVGNLLAVPIGEAITIRVTNDDSVTHNLRVAGSDGVFETEDDAVTTPDAIGTGVIGELSFSPPVDGYFTFRCDFHPTSMGGQIVAGDPQSSPVTHVPTATPTPSASPPGETAVP